MIKYLLTILTLTCGCHQTSFVQNTSQNKKSQPPTPDYVVCTVKKDTERQLALLFAYEHWTKKFGEHFIYDLKIIETGHQIYIVDAYLSKQWPEERDVYKDKHAFIIVKISNQYQIRKNGVINH
jgi:hypothetical protein